MFYSSYDDKEYCALLKKTTDIEWSRVPQEMLVSPAGVGMHTYAVTPQNIQHTTDWDYYQPMSHSLAMFPDHFVKNILKSKFDVPVSQPAYVYQVGAEKKMVSTKLPPQVVGDFLINAELELTGQIKLIRDLSLNLDDFGIGTLSLDGNHADENFKAIISSMRISDFDKNKGVELSLCCSNKYNSTSFSLEPGEPLKFTAEFEPETGSDIGYWLDWKVATNLSMVLKGEVTPAPNSNSKLYEEIKRIIEYSAIALAGVIVAVGLFMLAPEVLGILVSAGARLLARKAEA